MRYEIWCIGYVQNIFFYFFFYCVLGNYIIIVVYLRFVQIVLDVVKQLEGEGVDCEVCFCYGK